MKHFRRALVRSLAAASLFLVSLASAAAALAAPAAGVSATVSLRADGVYYGANAVGTPTFPLLVEQSFQVRQGSGLNQADKIYAASRTVAASTSESLDLAGGLTDPLGGALTFAKVKTILITASATNTNNVVLGGVGSNAFLGPFGSATDKVAIPPGGAVLLTHPGSGWTVTASTGDLLQVANSGAGSTVTYRVVVIGTSS